MKTRLMRIAVMLTEPWCSWTTLFIVLFVSSVVSAVSEARGGLTASIIWLPLVFALLFINNALTRYIDSRRRAMANGAWHQDELINSGHTVYIEDSDCKRTVTAWNTLYECRVTFVELNIRTYPDGETHLLLTDERGAQITFVGKGLMDCLYQWKRG